MKKELTANSVEFIIVHASSSTIKEDLQVADIEKRRLAEGFSSSGYHFVITRDGEVHNCTPLDQAGSHTDHFDDRSIGVLIVGGKTTRGKPSNNYTSEQLIALQVLVLDMKALFTKAEAVGVGELLGGTNPHIRVNNYG